MNNWTDEVNEILEKLRKNSIELSHRHRKNFYEYKSYSKYFDIPIIVVSVLSSSFSVGANAFLSQELVSVSTCGISMMVAILTSVKLYLQLEENIKIELEMSKSFHTLALDIFKVLNLQITQRNGNGLDYLNKKYSDYIKLVESSNLLRKNLKKDFLLEIDSSLLNDDSSLSSNEEKHFERFTIENVSSAIDNARQHSINTRDPSINVLDSHVNAVESQVNASESQVNEVESQVNASESQVNSLEVTIDE